MNKKEIIQRLSEGKVIVGYRESGNSMTPIIKHKQPLTLAPVDTSKLEKGDIVLAKVRGRFYTHKVLGVKKGQVQIGNNKGHVNGWTKLDNVFGIVTEIDGKKVGGAEKKRKKGKSKVIKTVKTRVAVEVEFKVDDSWDADELLMITEQMISDEIPSGWDTDGLISWDSTMTWSELLQNE